ncbi:MAG: transcription factor S [Candidatus Aenigmarchaeota archaeon]|nr:transcription factor S [Candidatus Aenigmarchaeota archaeon]
MKFCDKCGNLMLVEKRRKHSFFVCRKCGRTAKIKDEKVTITEAIHEPRRGIVIMGRDEGIAEFPKTKIICPKCENAEAYWWMQQTRAADEPPTLFYKCTRCGYAWRSYG